jgi:hypothetical protein
MTGHQREMPLCEIMKYATVNPVMAAALFHAHIHSNVMLA